ncbi:MAG: DUF1295 domain-containing protein [Candidatus Margulisiibacteriota bacterium]|nr:DUF1295 domain-containing protein [Candidatus Margulisiibacteriota bacterium]
MPIVDFFLNAFFICFFILLGLIPIILLTKKLHLFDLFWGAGIATSAISVSRLHAVLTPINIIILVFVFLWGARLFCFLLYTRVLTFHKDSRYELINTSSLFKTSIKQLVFQSILQAVMVFAVYPLTAIDTLHTPFVILGGTLFVIGLIGQSIADLQLYNFKKKNQTICNVGLWRYSRHPNYFFECMIWLGISISFLPNFEFLFSFIAPVTIFIIVYFITGPLTEKSSLKKHGEIFANYQNTTSYFFPRPNK